MARFRKEKYDPERHQSHMSHDGSRVKEVYFVTVCGFEFEFHSLAQIEQCLEYYLKKTHPSSRMEQLNGNLQYGGDWPEVRRLLRPWKWFERLPMYLLEESKRRRVVKALQRSLGEFSKG